MIWSSIVGTNWVVTVVPNYRRIKPNDSFEWAQRKRKSKNLTHILRLG